MCSPRTSIRLTAVLAIAAVILLATSAGMAQESVIFSFNFSDGNAPDAGPILDSAGNLYGTIPGGGANGLGLVYELVPSTGGGWSEVILYSFSRTGGDGQSPDATLLFDAAGNLYSTTPSGGAFGLGAVFELSPQTGGGWTETVLYSFGSGSDGQTPLAGLVLDKKGNLYGTTSAGGTDAGGTAFKLSPQPGGGWAETVIHNFNNNGTDGYFPQAALTLHAGNLYGTASRGGAFAGGVVFELSPNSEGGWTESLLHTFHSGATDGGNPSGALIFNAAGNSLYGTAGGGRYAEGVVFELSRTASGVWVESLLHNFLRNNDGRSPSGLVFDASGRLYGTTSAGGGSGFGTAYQLTPTAGGSWNERVLHSFNLFDGDGAYPVGPPVFDSAGNLYGAADQGGVDEDGAVFEVKL